MFRALPHNVARRTSSRIVPILVFLAMLASSLSGWSRREVAADFKFTSPVASSARDSRMWRIQMSRGTYRCERRKNHFAQSRCELECLGESPRGDCGDVVDNVW
jgi:hypothetical protein